MYLAEKDKNFAFWRAQSGKAPIKPLPIFVYVKFIFNTYPFRKFDPSICSGVKVQNLEDSIEEDLLNLAPPISVAH